MDPSPTSSDAAPTPRRRAGLREPATPGARAAGVALLLGAVAGAEPAPARAAASALFAVGPDRPTISLGAALFPESVPGYNQELGLTLPTVVAIGPAQQGLGVRNGPMLLLPALSVSTGYDSNVLGYRHAPGSTIQHTTPSVSLDGDWARTRVGLYLGVDNSQYFQLANQSHTDVTLGAGGSVAVGRGEATIAYSHLALHDDPASIGAIPSTSPTPFTVDDLRASLDLELGRAALRPFFEASRWVYGRADLGGQRLDQSARDRDVLQAGVALRYTVAERRDLLATVSVDRNDYLHAQPGSPAPSSTDALALGGIDYEADGALRLRLLAGVQARRFDTAAYRAQVAPVGQLSLFWTPQQITTVTFTLARSLEDLAQEDTIGTIFSRAEIALSHALQRDVVLRARIGVQSAEFLQLHGTDADFYGSAGFEWSFDRRIKLIGDIELQRNSAPVGVGVVPVSGPYTRAIGRLGVTIAI